MIVRILTILFMASVFPSPARSDDSREAHYSGKSIKEWLKILSQPNEEEHAKARNALIQIARDDRQALRSVIDQIVALPIQRTDQDFDRLQKFGPLLHEWGAPAAAVLHPYLWSDDGDKRFRAALALALLGSKGRGAAPGLIELIENEIDDQIFQAALFAIDRMPDLAFLPSLVRVMDGKDTQRSLAAARVLTQNDYAASKYPPSNYFGILKKWLKGDDVQRLNALKILSRIGREATPFVEELNTVLEKGNAKERLMCAVILEQIGRSAPTAITALQKMIAGDDPYPAVSAAIAVSRIGVTKDAKAHLLKNCMEDQSPYRLMAAETLWRLDRSTEAITCIKNILANGDNKEKTTALEFAMCVGPSGRALIPELITFLEDKNPNNRITAVRALGRMGPVAKVAKKGIQELLKDDEEFIRLHAALALARIDPDLAPLGILTGMLTSKDAIVRTHVLRELTASGPLAKLALPEIRKRLGDDIPSNRMAALEAMWYIDHDPTILDQLRKEVRNSSGAPDVAAAVLGETFGPEAKSAIPDLMMALWDEPSQSSVAEALGRMGPAAKSAIPALVRVLQTEGRDWAAYSASAEALGLIGAEAKAAIPTLDSLLTHPDRLTRVHAALALWRIDRRKDGEAVIADCRLSRQHNPYITALEAEWLMKQNPQAIRDLIQELRDASLSTDPQASNRCYMVARALGRCGPAARDALPDLRDLLYDEDPVLRRHVGRVIGEIEGKK